MTDAPLNGAAVLLDLDGTMADTAPDLAGTMNDVLAKLALPPLPVEQVRPLVGHGARALMVRGLAAHGRTAAPAELDQMLVAFLDIYGGRIAKESRLYPRTQMTLDLLIAGGAKLGVVTNKPEGLSRLLLDALGVADRFGALIGRETAARPKPFPDPILLAAERLKVPLSSAILIGDSDTDVGAARAAGIPIVLMRHGYTTKPPEELGADTVIDGFAELIGAITPLLARRRA
jgi:phosphoglycolate phosphatase